MFKSNAITYANNRTVFQKQVNLRIKKMNEIEKTIHKQSPDMVAEYNQLMEEESLDIQLKKLDQFKEKMKAKAKKPAQNKQSQTSQNKENRKKITVTPINLINPSSEFGKIAKVDYLREKENSRDFTAGCNWDDTASNKSSVGDYFGFVQQAGASNIIEIYEILEINASRPEYWTIEEHKDRRVLSLSPKISEMPCTEFKELSGHSSNYMVRGTVKLNYIE